MKVKNEQSSSEFRKPILSQIYEVGAYTDSTGGHGRATYTYRVCQAGTSTCSSNATVSFGGPGP